MLLVVSGVMGQVSINVGDLDTSEVTNMASLFSGFLYLKKIEGLETWDTSQVTKMSCMFNDCKNLEKLIVKNFDTSKVTDMSFMFNGCWNLKELDLSSFDLSRVDEVDWMISSCYKLEEIKGIKKVLISEAYRKLKEYEQKEVFKNTKIDLEKELKKLNKKEIIFLLTRRKNENKSR